MTPWLHQLRKIAEGATKGPWSFQYTPTGPCGQMCYADMIMSEARYPPINIARRPGYDSLGPRQEINNAVHICRFDPPTVKLLLDVVEAAKALCEDHCWDNLDGDDEYRGRAFGIPEVNYLGLAESLNALERHLEPVQQTDDK